MSNKKNYTFSLDKETYSLLEEIVKEDNLKKSEAIKVALESYKITKLDLSRQAIIKSIKANCVNLHNQIIEDLKIIKNNS